MKAYLGGLVLCLACSLGCTQMFVPGADLEAKMRASSAAPPVPINAEQVTTQNAHRMSQALWEELDRETNRDLLDSSATLARK